MLQINHIQGPHYNTSPIRNVTKHQYGLRNVDPFGLLVTVIEGV